MERTAAGAFQAYSRITLGERIATYPDNEEAWPTTVGAGRVEHAGEDPRVSR
jgi:hypothetical protein